MKQIIIIPTILILLSCGNNKTESAETQQPAAEVDKAGDIIVTENAAAANIVYDVEGTSVSNSASVLVTKDKGKLKADAPYICMLTSNAAAHNNEYLTLNFLLTTRPGVYPVVGSSFNRGPNDKSEMYGGLLGGKPAVTAYSVTITTCKDLGDNKQGGHRWSISGYWEGLIIPAAKIMLLDKSSNHPKEIKLGKGSFTNLEFDDNWDEMLEKGMNKLGAK